MIRVVHRDHHLLVVDKPSGLPTTAPGGGDCLVARVRGLDPDAPRLHPTSRLDAEVSGLVTFARTRHATLALQEARRRHAYRRRYLALTPPPAQTSGHWEASIGIDPRDPRRRCVDEGPASKPAATRWHRVAVAGPVALLALEPETGRTHQLRVHASDAGLPITGDRHYGGARRVTLTDGRVLSARRTLLHCAGLRLPLLDGDLVSEPPDDFMALWVGVGGDPAAVREALRPSPASTAP